MKLNITTSQMETWETWWSRNGCSSYKTNTLENKELINA